MNKEQFPTKLKEKWSSANWQVTQHLLSSVIASNEQGAISYARYGCLADDTINCKFAKK